MFLWCGKINKEYFVNSGSLAHVCFSERQKKRKVEQMEDGIEELKEKLRVTQLQLQAERETDNLRRQHVSLCLNQDPASHIALNLLNNPISVHSMSISNVWYLLNIVMFFFEFFWIFFWQFSRPYSTGIVHLKISKLFFSITTKVDGDLQISILGFE